jgi:riboflavin biosynthesis pyrimidine reductase
VLVEEPAKDATAIPLEGELQRIYGGSLVLPPVGLYANFVQTIDGVVTLPGVESPGSVISGRSPADRFVMGLLRASADAILIGAGTLRDTPGHHWTAPHIYPDLAAQFSALRTRLGLADGPRLLVITATGAIAVAHPAIEEGATILTTTAGAARLAGILPAGCEVKAWPGERVPLEESVRWLHEQGYRRILSEAGPTIMGQLLEHDLLDDLFVTVSPVFGGRDGAGRYGLVEGTTLLPGRRLEVRLTSARRSGAHLLLRYSLA